MIVRPASEDEAPAAAALHRDGIREGFLPQLGRPFLVRLYRRIVRSPNSFLLVADDQGTIVGHAAATEDVGKLYRDFLVRDGLPAAALAAPRLARLWRPALETLRYPSGGGQLPAAELLAVAVDAERRGRGIGRLLVNAVTDQLTRRGIRDVRVVVASDNVKALNLYKSCGFRPRSQIHVHAGTSSEILTWS